MLFTCEQLLKIAPTYFKVDPGFEFVEVRHDSLNKKVLTIKNSSSKIHISAIGYFIRLYFHVHKWCGSAEVICNDVSSVLDLYASEHGYKEIEFKALGSQSIELELIANAKKANPQALGNQFWLVGIEFSERQPWMPRSIPISDSCDVVFGQFGTFIVLSTDSVIGSTISRYGIWAEKDVELFSKEIRPGMVVVDIGANIGHHSIVFSKLVGPNGQILSFEPQKILYRIACTNLVLNECDNVDIFPYCIGNSDGFTQMSPISYKVRNNFGALSVDRMANKSMRNGGEKVAMRRLDSLFKDLFTHIKKIDFIKVDVQSFELFVLQGGIETIKRYKPNIFIEISPYWMQLRGYNYRDIYSFLQNYGYRFHHIDNGAGIENSIRKWSGVETEEWDVYAICN